MNIDSLVEQFNGCRVLVVGDLMLDEYIWGTADRISPEAPVPVVRCRDRTHAAGGAANVVANIAALGGSPTVCGIVGDDAPGVSLTETLEAFGAEVRGVFRDGSRCTTRKTRVIAQQQQVVRIDHESHEPVSGEIREKMDGYIREQVAGVDGIIFSDYNKGVLTDHHLATWIPLSREQQKIVTAGPKPQSLRDYGGATLLSFNRSEAYQSVQNLPRTPSPGIERSRDAAEQEDADPTGAGDALAANEVDRIGEHLIEELQCDAITITRGGEGVSVFTFDGQRLRVPGMPVQVYDVAGAGDTFLSAITLALCCGADWATAAGVANAAAACVVRKVGVATTNPQEILQLMGEVLY